MAEPLSRLELELVGGCQTALNVFELISGTGQVIEKRSNEIYVIDEVRRRHLERGEAWLAKNAEGYLSYYWDDVSIFALGQRITIASLRSWLIELLAAGGGPITINLPPAEDIVISQDRDAATTSYYWDQRWRTMERTEDRRYYETNVWYCRNHVWKIIHMHVTLL